MIHAFATAYGWSAEELDQISLLDALALLDAIEERYAQDALKDYAVLMSMMESCFADKKGEPAFIREMRRLSDGERLREYTRAEARTQREEFLGQYPAFRTVGCRVERDAGRNAGRDAERAESGGRQR